ncbi:DUF4173 domain-containing protein [Paenibacillus sp. N4]|uniref:DUF4153 domain-containing protein n=1 Tax=Paenibacillus vietnamensis TaxID=2590547 RepID=UPI001CD1607D|nr:DUF4173 domain-containing protein [Paenibacillus vietnamensis]MCA0758706.1 DUF4173 domain-containing protein [Paenibacillus vietnamensis]
MRDPAPWQKRYERMALLALLFGLVSQYLFVGAVPGLSVPLFAAAFYGLYFYSVKGRLGGFERWQGQLSSGWLLFLPIFFLAAAFALFDNSLFRVLNMPVLFALVVAQTVLLTRSSELPWHRGAFYGELLAFALIRPLAYIAVPFTLFYDRWATNRQGPGESARGKLGKVTLGLLLAAPLLIVVVSLLASADGIFESWLNRIPELFGNISFGDGMIRFMVGGFFSWYAFCYIWSLMFRKPAVKKTGAGAGREAAVSARVEMNAGAVKDGTVTGQMDRAPEAGSGTRAALRADAGLDAGAAAGWTPGAAAAAGPVRFDPITAATFLISVNAVYLLFVAIQFSYLFGAAGGLLPEGAAYAEYARRGFAELVMVTLINIGLLMCGLHLIRRAGALAELVRKVSLTVLMGSTIVMLVSAFSRLSLYEEAYGFTQMRLLVHGFMIYLGLLLAVAVVRIWKERFSMAKVYIGISIAAYVVMNYVNVDARVAEQNIRRYEATGKIDFQYLGGLSTDAAPALLRLQEKLPQITGLDAAVSRLQARAQSSDEWQSWNLSKQLAK